MPVERPAFQEATSLGAAYAAGLAVGLYTSKQVFQLPVEASTNFEPQASKEDILKRYASWKLAVQRSFDLDGLC